ncbi:DUF3797 domain-containing protein [Shouchella clausii]|uniref:DUF3797 domain-containing protein n=1 Tax=Shouchella clausii TaxID=79880 RepID=UPI0026F46A8E|nr:DUF3797 domain-containing protein [Shouchella clausii]MDO7281769.1 DUF3797 domain-containing protein [Shouchella clausii]MDO7301864.1 DUF3797 domain-containing protein [Shouchella clausii]
MNWTDLLKLGERYATCPTCGNDKVGNGEGKLFCNKDEFYRSCKCGWEVAVKDGEEV